MDNSKWAEVTEFTTEQRRITETHGGLLTAALAVSSHCHVVYP